MLFANKIIKFASLDSTQNYAKQLAKQGKPEGTLVVAEQQTAGRGRFRRPWDSPLGGLWFSFLLYPKNLSAKLSLITLISALSVLQAIRKIVALEPMIKWPNDLWIEGKKVCGILTEAGWKAENLAWVVVGIGLDVNNPIPPELRQKAGSLSELSGEKITISELFIEILNQLDVYYARLKAGKEKKILAEVKKYSLVIGKEVLIETSHRFIRGKVIDLAADGALALSTAKGKEKIISGEINLIY